MSRAVRFYRMLGFVIVHGGDDAGFTSFRAGTNYLNLIAQPAERNWSWWGRVIFYHSDVDSLHASVVAAGYRPDTAPRDGEWGERFFHLTDPDGHELSFAWPLRLCETADAVARTLYNLPRVGGVVHDDVRIASSTSLRVKMRSKRACALCPLRG
jgi:hypothetical protein